MQAIAGGATNKPKEQIVDFDSADVNDDLAVVEYVDDMYKFYKLEEVIFFSSFRLLGFSIFFHFYLMNVTNAGCEPSQRLLQYTARSQFKNESTYHGVAV